MNAFEAFKIIAKTEFSPMNEADFETFAGAQNEDAVIGEYEGGVIIIDGDMVQFMYETGDFETFRLKGI
jgi:translation elongation factor P/translation initiation factor 5A